MNKAYMKSIGIGILILVVGFGLNKGLASQKKDPKPKDATQNIRKVSTIDIQNKRLQPVISDFGTLKALDKIELYAEVSGIVEPRFPRFKEGLTFKKGQTILKLDGQQSEFNLKSQKSRFLNSVTALIGDYQLDFPSRKNVWESYVDAFDINRPLPDLPQVKNRKEKYFLSARNILEQYYSIKSLEENQSKFDVVAPFDGVVIESHVEDGNLVKLNQKMGTIVGPGRFECEVSVSLDELPLISQGQTVTITSSDLPGKWQGQVAYINQGIDANSQTVLVGITVDSAQLKDGMYVNVDINGKAVNQGFAFPRYLLLPEDQVFVVEGNMLKTVAVDVISKSKTTVIAKGLANGTQLLGQSIPSAYEGMKVITD